MPATEGALETELLSAQFIAELFFKMQSFNILIGGVRSASQKATFVLIFVTLKCHLQNEASGSFQSFWLCCAHLKASTHDEKSSVPCCISRIHSPEEVLGCLEGEIQPDPVLFLQA